MLGPCDNCAESGSSAPRAAKYRCPACGALSCCLSCVKAHKARRKCSGVRNRAAPVRRRDFNEEMLMNDYTLLEDASRATAASARATAESAPPAPSASARSKRAILAREAAARQVHLHLLPRGFARGKRNTSHARGRKGARVLWWHLDVVMMQPGKERRINVDSCPETTSIGEIVNGAIGALSRRGKKSCVTRTISSPISDSVLDEYEVFVLNEHVVGPSSSGPEHVTVPGKAIGEDNLHRYLPLEKSASLANSIANRTIIEFPILYVAKTGSSEAKQLSVAKAGVFEKPEPDSSSSSEWGVDSSSSDDELSARDSQEEVLDKSEIRKTIGASHVDGDSVDADVQATGRPLKRPRLVEPPKM